MNKELEVTAKLENWWKAMPVSVQNAIEVYVSNQLEQPIETILTNNSPVSKELYQEMQDYLGLLGSLHLKATSSLDQGFESLKQYKALKHITLEAYHLDSLDFLRELEHVTSVCFSDCTFAKGMSFENLNKKNCTLKINSSVQQEHIVALKNVEHLNVIYKACNKHTFEIDTLALNPKVKSLSFEGASVVLNQFIEYIERVAIDNLDGNYLSKIINLKLTGAELANTTFLNKLSNLQSLDLTNNQLNDLPIGNYLSGIKKLNLSRNKLNNIQFIESCHVLRSYNANMNEIGDIAPLTDCKLLEHLSLAYNQIKLIDALAELEQLQILNVQNNELCDLSPILGRLHQLTVLKASNNFLEQIDGIGELVKLNSLDLSGNKLINIKDLSCLHNLTYLNLNGNQISDLSPLYDLPKLREIRLVDNKLSSKVLNDFRTHLPRCKIFA